MRFFRKNVGLIYLACLLAAFSQPVTAQSSVILVIDLERVYKTSKFGQSLRDTFNFENQAFNEENKVILNRLKDEEIQLTAVDTKVQEIRKTRLEQIRVVEERFKMLKPMFFRRVDSFFDVIMREFDATAILEKSSVVRSNQNIDITDLLIERVDQAFLANQSIKETNRQD